MALNTDKSWYQVQTQSMSCSYHYEIFPEVLAYEFTCTYTYQISSKRVSRNLVPCDNEKISWIEVVSGLKGHLDLITNYLQQNGIGCLPIENVSTLSQIKIFPVGCYQWRNRSE